VNAGTGNVTIAGGVGADGALALLNVTQASDVRIGAVTAQQLRINARGEVSIDAVATRQTTISASKITGGMFNVDTLSLDADLARIQASVGGRSDRSIFNRIVFGRSGVYIINGQDAASILQSISRVPGAERFTQLLSKLNNSDSSSSDDKKETAEGGKKDGNAKPLFKISAGETTRSAASEEPVPGLRGRFPTLANFALW
jgi:hypothetical protein